MIRKFILTCIVAMACCSVANAAFSPKEIIPADGQEVASLSKVTVIWPGDWLEDVTFDECGRVEDEQGTRVATITCEENWGKDGAACDFILSEKISTPGTYTIYVDADAVQGEDEEWNEAFQLTYKVVSASDAKINLVSVNPENNAVVSMLSKIETVWSEEDLSINREMQCSVTDSEGEVVSEIEVSKGYFSSDPVTFTLSKSIETAGTYKVTIPAGVLETEDGVKSEAVELTYIVDPTAVIILHPVTVDPEDKATVSMLYKINITWDGEFDFDYEAEEVGKVTDELGTTVATLNCAADMLEEYVGAN